MWSPWDTIGVFDQVLDDVMRRPFGVSTNGRTYVPEVEVRSDDDRIRLYVDVPGVKREDLAITFENGVLTISGTRKFDSGDGSSFSRSFTLPEHLDGDKLTAHLADGVLAIEVPKQAKAKARKIPVLGGDPQPALGEGGKS